MLPHVFVAMPFGTKPGQNGTLIDFNRIYHELLKPALTSVGLEVMRADEEVQAGDIKTDMFQELLIADLVVVDLTLDNPNVWYELGVRHALRARGVMLVQAERNYQPFDIYTDRKLHYTLKDGAPDPTTRAQDLANISAMALATLESWHGRKISPVFHLLPNLEEPQWKRLKLGAANAFWQAHDAWAQRIELARQAQKPGDILVLAEEAPIAAFRAEAYYAAAQALLQLECFDFALQHIEQCLTLEPTHTQAQHKKGICLQRLQKFSAARLHYQALLAQQPQDAETLALLARLDKDAWLASWRLPEYRSEQMRAEATYEATLLRNAINGYLTAFKTAPAHYYSGINALTLIHLYRHLTQDPHFNSEITKISGGIIWAASCEQSPSQLFWAKATLADVAVLSASAEQVTQAYQEAIACANNDRFALHATLAQLGILQDLGFRPAEVSAGIVALQRALARLPAPMARWQPQRIILFSGHMIDSVERTSPRFPPEFEADAHAQIEAALQQMQAGPDDLALTQGANGGDLLFAEACVQRGVKLQLMQPFAEADFIARSIAPAGEDWCQRFFALKANLALPIQCMPDELGLSQRNPFERCNLWLLYSALAYGPEKVTLLCLWNGLGGDAPGGTAHMVAAVKKHTGKVIRLSLPTSHA